MKKIFGLFVMGILSSTAMAEYVCPEWRIEGCAIFPNAATQEEYCPDYIWKGTKVEE